MLPGPAPALSDHMRPQVRAHRPTDMKNVKLRSIFENHPHDLWIWKALKCLLSTRRMHSGLLEKNILCLIHQFRNYAICCCFFLQFHLFHVIAKCCHSGQCFQSRKSFMLSIKAETGRVCWCYLLFSDSMMIHHE